MQRKNKRNPLFKTWCEECQQWYKFSFIPAYHERSTLHRYGRRIRALLDANCLTLTEIGNRVGITRERVRQIAKDYFGVTGRIRQGVCRLTRRDEKLKIQKDRLADFPIGQVMAKLNELQIPFETVLSKNGIEHGRLLVNGKICKILKCGPRTTYRHRARYRNIRPPKSHRLDFCIYVDPKHGFLVMPKDKLPKHATAFILDAPLGENRLGAYSLRHDFIDYLDAWDQLR
jgi:transcriptional regulator with XRE-family HTH domain